MKYLLLFITAVILLTGCGTSSSPHNTYYDYYIESDISHEYIYSIEDSNLFESNIGYGMFYGVGNIPYYDNNKISDISNNCGYDFSLIEHLGDISYKYMLSSLSLYNDYHLYEKGTGKVVDIEYNGYIQTHNVKSYEVYQDSTMINLQMIKDGYAIATSMEDIYIDAEAEARYNQRGLWYEYYDVMDCIAYNYQIVRVKK